MTHHIPFLSLEHPIRLAHRGSSILWPENTLYAFQAALEHGCKYIESDLHVTKDEVIVMFHDDTLERVTDGKGRIDEWNWKDLQSLDAAYYFKPEEGYPLRGKGIAIPSLEEVMTTFPHLHFNLDLKQPGIEETAAKFINRFNYFDRVLLASFKGRRTRRCRRLLNQSTAISAGVVNVLLAWCATRLRCSLVSSIAAFQVPQHHGRLTIADRKFIDAAHAAGIHVHVWIINEPQQMKHLIDLGVDGLVTDRIDLLNAVLESSPKS